MFGLSLIDMSFRLDYEGQRVKISTLAPLSAFSVQTHPSHPWIFRDADTNESLVIKKLNVKGSFFETSDYLVSALAGWHLQGSLTEG
jgi:VHL beta domain